MSLRDAEAFWSAKIAKSARMAVKAAVRERDRQQIAFLSVAAILAAAVAWALTAPH